MMLTEWQVRRRARRNLLARAKHRERQAMCLGKTAKYQSEFELVKKLFAEADELRAKANDIGRWL